MSLVDHYTWEVKKELSAGESIQFKFDALGNWSTNWGDSNGDGTADPGAANISFSASVPGEYTFQFRDDTSAYDLSFSGSGDPPHAPTELSAQATGPRSILLSWNGSAGAESYVLEDSNGGYLAEVTDTTYEVLNLSPETTYSFELRAENAFGSSSTVGPVSSTTDPLGTSNTVIRVHYDTGMGNFIAVRGNTSPLSWGSGLSADWTSGNVWVIEIDGIPEGESFSFKPLINDVVWSQGSDFSGQGERLLTFIPTFKL
jgi:chitodextrinase